jgi:hypothetical protein
VTENFIDSVWCRREFREAKIPELVDVKRNRIIVITHNNTENSDKMDDELNSYLRLHLFVKFEDPRFWQKLVYSMPHQNHRRPLLASGESPENIEFMGMKRKFKQKDASLSK